MDRNVSGGSKGKWENPLDKSASSHTSSSSSRIGESSITGSKHTLPPVPLARSPERSYPSYRSGDRPNKYRDEDRPRESGERSRERRDGNDQGGHGDEAYPSKRPRYDLSPERNGQRGVNTYATSRYDRHSSDRNGDSRRDYDHPSSTYDNRRHEYDDRSYGRARDNYQAHNKRNGDRRDDRDRYERSYHERDNRHDERNMDSRGYDERARDSKRYDDRRREDRHRDDRGHDHHKGSPRRQSRSASSPKIDHLPIEKSRKSSPRKVRSPSHEDGEIEDEPIPPGRPPTPPSPPPDLPSVPSAPSRKLTMKNRPVQPESFKPRSPSISPPRSIPPPPQSVPPPPDSNPPSPPSIPPPPPDTAHPDIAPPPPPSPRPLNDEKVVEDKKSDEKPKQTEVEKEKEVMTSTKASSGPAKDRTLSRQASEIPLGPGCPIKYRRPDTKEEKEKYGRKFVGTRRLAAYDSGKILGEGTFGVVTEAIEKTTKRRVALKKLLVHNPRDGVSLTTVREVKLLKSLNHKNVVSILDMVVEPEKGSKAGRQEVFMVFPFMDHDLCGLLSNRAFKLTASIAKAFMKQLLEGMAYIHANNIIHRDIKTANILVDDAGVIMIADFGLARPVSVKPLPPHLEDELTNMVVTRWYRAPELLLGETKYGPAIDMWSIGCIIGELWKKTPILPGGPNDVDQLYEIFSRCGPLNEETFPGWKKLPGHPGHETHQWDQRVHLMPLLRTIASPEWRMDAGAIDLMMKLLKYDPKVRLTAEEALDHPYLHINPLPSLPKSLHVESSHEYTAKKEERQAAAAVVAPPPAVRPNHQRPPQNWRGPPPHQPQRPPWQGQQNPYGGIPPNGPSNLPPNVPMGMNMGMPGQGMGMAGQGMGMGMGRPPPHHPQRLNPQATPYQPNMNPYGPGPGMPPGGPPANRGTHPPPAPFALRQNPTSAPAPPFKLAGQASAQIPMGGIGRPPPPGGRWSKNEGLPY